MSNHRRESSSLFSRTRKETAFVYQTKAVSLSKKSPLSPNENRDFFDKLKSGSSVSVG